MWKEESSLLGHCILTEPPAPYKNILGGKLLIRESFSSSFLDFSVNET